MFDYHAVACCVSLAPGRARQEQYLQVPSNQTYVATLRPGNVRRSRERPRRKKGARDEDHQLDLRQGQEWPPDLEPIQAHLRRIAEEVLPSACYATPFIHATPSVRAASFLNATSSILAKSSILATCSILATSFMLAASFDLAESFELAFMLATFFILASSFMLAASFDLAGSFELAFMLATFFILATSFILGDAMTSFRSGRYEKKYGRDESRGKARIVLEQTWASGAAGVQKAIDSGALRTFYCDGVEFCAQREVTAGIENGRETAAEVKQAPN